MSLEQAARDLTQAVSGIDYDGAEVHKCRVALHGGMASAAPDELAAALRGLVYRMLADGVVSNFDLHALVGDVLVERGLPAPRNPPELIAYIKGESPTRGADSSVAGQFQFYEWQAAAYDWEDGDKQHPAGHYVWGEGIPSGVPKFKDVPTLIVGPQTIRRSWNNARTFGGLKSNVTVTEELKEDEVVSLLAEMKAAVVPVEPVETQA
ncbi:hypothetical protein PWT90_01380 [Aphanocladium album]|nr:hypothetical protein PWT90_01380 [Aphanocladium album]